MTPQDFCYWLQGRAELLPDQPPSPQEWEMIREHLRLVFKKVTASPLNAYKQPMPFRPLDGGIPLDAQRAQCKAIAG